MQAITIQQADSAGGRHFQGPRVFNTPVRTGGCPYTHDERVLLVKKENSVANACGGAHIDAVSCLTTS